MCNTKLTYYINIAFQITCVLSIILATLNIYFITHFSVKKCNIYYKYLIFTINACIFSINMFYHKTNNKCLF